MLSTPNMSEEMRDWKGLALLIFKIYAYAGAENPKQRDSLCNKQHQITQSKSFPQKFPFIYATTIMNV